MRALFKGELHLDWKIACLTIFSTLLILLDRYHTFTPSKSVDRVILYLLIPVVVTLVLFREQPFEYGLRLGDWKAGLGLTALVVLLAVPLLWWVVRGDTSMRDYYRGLVPGLPWNTFADLIGWEFMFRGWLLFGYERKFGPEALWLQAVPFALAHIGKPEVETLSTIFGGFVFGWVAYRTRSFIYPFLIHWFVFSFVILVAAGAFG